MKLLLYNVCYCMGVGKGYKDYVLKNRRIKLDPEVLDQIACFIKQQDPDIVCLVETDSGSIRCRHVDQAEYIKEKLGFYSIASFCKYGDSLLSSMPYFKHLGNSVLFKHKFGKVKKHNLKSGSKKLMIEVQISGLVIYLVHLSLSTGARKQQLMEITTIINKNKGPKLVLGDFNTFKGDHELSQFMENTGLLIARHNLKTFPSWKPKKCLDHVLHSKDVNVGKISVPKVNLSDHLPIIVDFKTKR